MNNFFQGIMNVLNSEALGEVFIISVLIIVATLGTLRLIIFLDRQ